MTTMDPYTILKVMWFGAIALIVAYCVFEGLAPKAD